MSSPSTGIGGDLEKASGQGRATGGAPPAPSPTDRSSTKWLPWMTAVVIVQVDPSVVFRETDAALGEWDYVCFTPKAGLSEPRVTMLTVIGGLPPAYQAVVMENRLQYAHANGYRYCELQVMDQHKIPAFTKLPIMLALAPCTDYVFHLDADAQLVNMHLSLDPWIDFMTSKDIDQLFAADVIKESAINYGVFMIRTAPWIWDFYRKMYNMCTCDWSRMHDWPAEQGIVYDLLAQHLDSTETRRSMIVANKGWNHILDHPDQAIQPEDRVVHITFPTKFAENSSCWNATEFTRACKYESLEYFMTKVIGSDQYKKFADGKTIQDQFNQDSKICQQVRQNSLFEHGTTYNSSSSALSASVMDFDLDPNTHRVTGIKIGEVACQGYRENKCSLPYQWDTKKGEGPWKVNRQDIV